MFFIRQCGYCYTNYPRHYRYIRKMRCGDRLPLTQSMVVCFIVGGNRSTQRKPPTCPSHWQTLSYNIVSSTPRHERGSNSQLALIAQVVINLTTIRPRPRPPIVVVYLHIQWTYITMENCSSILAHWEVYFIQFYIIWRDKFEDSNGVNRSSILKDRQYNG